MTRTDQAAAPASDDSFILTPSAMFCLVDGEGCLVDLCRGRFAGLNRSATYLMQSVLRHGAGLTTISVSQEWSVPEAVIWDDLVTMKQELLVGGFLAGGRTADGSCLRPGNALRTIFRACVMPHLKGLHRQSRRADSEAQLTRCVRKLLRAAWISLRVLGLSDTVELFRAATNSSGTAGNASDLVHIDGLIRAKAGSQLLSVACKERSVAGYFLLRARYALKPKIIIGLQRHPFRAHAWVECNGRVLTDDPEHCDFFVPVAELG